MKHEIIKNEKTSLMIKFTKENKDESITFYPTKVINELKEGKEIHKFRWFGDLEKEDEAVLAVIFE